MGLDMYLYAEVYVGRQAASWNPGVPDGAFDAIVGTLNIGSMVDDEDWNGMLVRVPVGYWRKANAIHGYIVQNHADGVDDCRPVRLTRDDLAKLRDLAASGLADRDKAGEVLPPTPGFFFGTYETDDWYFEDLKRTVEILDRVLASDRTDFTYEASW